jgi:flagellar protein FliL
MTAITQTPAEDGSATTPRRGLKGMLRILGLVLGAGVLAGGGFGAGWFVFSNTSSPMADALALIDRGTTADGAASQADGLPRLPRPLPAADSFVTTYFTFPEPLTTNPAGSRRFVQLGISLSTQYDPKVMTHVETHKVALQSDMLAVIGSFTEDEMSGRDGRDALALALRDAINARLTSLEGFGGIEGVFFPSFVLQ